MPIKTANVPTDHALVSDAQKRTNVSAHAHVAKDALLNHVAITEIAAKTENVLKNAALKATSNVVT